jgi:hypothetical protein
MAHLANYIKQRTRSILRRLRFELLPTSHTGLILLWHPLARGTDETSNLYQFGFEDDSEEIEKFYAQLGRICRRHDVDEWLSKGYKCATLSQGGRRLAAAWIWHGKCDLAALSGRCFSRKRSIEFFPGTAYLCLVSIRSEWQGQGLNTRFLGSIISSDYIVNGFERMVATTGTDNGGFIISSTRVGAKVIGVVAVRRWIGGVSRKEHFVDRSLRCWN